MDYSSVTRGEQ